MIHAVARNASVPYKNTFAVWVSAVKAQCKHQRHLCFPLFPSSGKPSALRSIHSLSLCKHAKGIKAVIRKYLQKETLEN